MSWLLGTHQSRSANFQSALNFDQPKPSCASQSQSQVKQDLYNIRTPQPQPQTQTQLSQSFTSHNRLIHFPALEVQTVALSSADLPLTPIYSDVPSKMVSSSRKRGREQMEAEAVEAPREPTLLQRIRNTWEFANLSQWIFTFGKAVKIDETWSDIEVCRLPWHTFTLMLRPSTLVLIQSQELEMECLKHNSPVLAEIGLALLKFVSSHRGLT